MRSQLVLWATEAVRSGSQERVGRPADDGIGADERGIRGLLGRVRGESTTPLRSRQLDRQIRLPVAGIYVRWNLGAPVATLEWDVKVLADPTSSVGIYLALAQGTIDGSTFYLGLQTDMSDPERLRGAGKGLIFSTWWTFDASATRLAPGGFRELGAHEGRFVGVRQPYPWVVGDYRITLVRSEPTAGCPFLPTGSTSTSNRRLVEALARVAPIWLAIGPGSGGWPSPVDMALCRH